MPAEEGDGGVQSDEGKGGGFCWGLVSSGAKRVDGRKRLMLTLEARRIGDMEHSMCWGDGIFCVCTVGCQHAMKGSDALTDMEI